MTESATDCVTFIFAAKRLYFVGWMMAKKPDILVSTADPLIIPQLRERGI